MRNPGTLVVTLHDTHLWKTRDDLRQATRATDRPSYAPRQTISGRTNRACRQLIRRKRLARFVFPTTLQLQCSAQGDAAPRLHSGGARLRRLRETRPSLAGIGIRWNRLWECSAGGWEVNPIYRIAFYGLRAEDRRRTFSGGRMRS